MVDKLDSLSLLGWIYRFYSSNEFIRDSPSLEKKLEKKLKINFQVRFNKPGIKILTAN